MRLPIKMIQMRLRGQSLIGNPLTRLAGLR